MNGPVTKVLLQKHTNGSFSVQVEAKGAGLTVIPPAPGEDGGVRIAINGGDTYCVAFGGAAGGRVTNKYAFSSVEPRHQNRVFQISSSGSAPTVQAGCPSPRVTNNGDGTVTDHKTGLQWELKTGSLTDGTNQGDILHGVGRHYAWAGCCNLSCNGFNCCPAGNMCQPNAAAEAACQAQTPSGQWASGGCNQCSAGTCQLAPNATTTVWEWLSLLNATSFAGHADWRLPSQDGCNPPPPNHMVRRDCDAPSELETIAASSIFGLTKPLPNYWSSTTESDPATAATQAWSRRFHGRYEDPTFDMDAWPKTADRPVRAVRQQ